MGRQHYLDQLDTLDSSLRTMGTIVVDRISASIEALEKVDVSGASHLIEADTEIDRMRHDIDERAFVLIATQQPAATDLRLIIASMVVAGELERIGDYCAGIAKLTLTIAQEPVRDVSDGVESMASVTRKLLAESLQAFHSRDVDAAADIWKRDDQVDELYQHIFSRLIDDMAKNKQHIRIGTYMLWVAHNIERMADRVTNIAEGVAFVATGDVASFRDSVRAESVPT